MPTLKQLFTLHPDLPQPVSISFNEAIDFCLWILEVDGLQVYPFQQQRRSLAEQRLQPQLNPVQIKEAIDDPSIAFSGNDLLSARLCEKWQQYQVVLTSRMAGRISVRTFLNNPDLETLPELNIFLVEYQVCTEFLQQPYYIVAAKFEDRSNEAVQELIQWSVKSLMGDQFR
jgi:hypothetical protein